MLKLLASLGVVLFALSFMPTEAAAWYCRADSARAYGWGESGYLSVARRRALAECAVRTPRGRVCRITYCR